MVKKPTQSEHRFGKDSRIVWEYSRCNKAWMVWREDGDAQALLRVHNNFDDALDDFNARVDFIKQMEGPDHG